MVIDSFVKVGESGIREAQIQEIDAILRKKYKLTYNEWLNLPSDKMISIGIEASIDMGWQKRSLGNTYDSKSGVTFLVGMKTKKILSCVIKALDCAKCEIAKKNGYKPIDHDCPFNFEGSSKSMECQAALTAVTQYHKRWGNM